MSQPAPAAQTARAPAASRRCPPEHSVSLRRPPVQNVLSKHAQPAQPAQPVSAASSLINNRDSSGESSNVDTWFENSNNNLDRDAHSRMADKEPPFFLRNHSSTDSPLDNARLAAAAAAANSTFPAPLNQLRSTGSSSEEYRSVIDDLTIQMKKMKRKLRRYEHLHDPHLQSEKLFEVRVHGLPPDKKRELEDMLRNFSATLNNPSQQITAETVGALSSSSMAAAGKHPTTSLTSTRFAADSGYGSMTTPSQVAVKGVPHSSSVAASGSQGGTAAASGSHGGLAAFSDATAKDQNVQSFLHDLPQALLQPAPSSMSERAKKRLVVSRLEQIFSGRSALADGSQQPIQQQEVSREAADDDHRQADPMANIRRGEGTREARIMLSGTGGASPDNVNPGLDRRDSSTDVPVDDSFLEQRPTRPLDLDPYRAQNASDNIEYMRHLGFTVPSKSSSPIDSEGWIYLNLLTSMAQLHTINVTPAFVKQAVSDFSQQLELSSDGRKIRWRAHRGRGMSSSNNNISMDSEDNDSPSGIGKPTWSGQKRSRSAFAASSGDDAAGERRNATRKLAPPLNEASFTYAPLFYRQDEDDDDASMADNESSTSSPDLTGEPSAMASGTGPGPAPQRSAEGPIIFYSNSYFCTDLSGDKGLPTLEYVGVDRQHQFTSKPLGADLKSDRQTSGSDRGAHTNRYFAEGGPAPVPPTSEMETMTVSDIEFPSGSESSSRHVSFAEQNHGVDFEVCGLGGVTPADNLAITVTKELRPKLPRRKFSVRTPPQTRLDGLLRRRPKQRDQQPSNDSRVLQVRTISLEPSQLPEPSMAYESDEEESEFETSPMDIAAIGRMPAQQLPSFGPGDGTPSSAQTSGASSSVAAESGSQSGVIDLLSLARQVDPAAIQAREREYDAQMAERLAEEIPAGSSAATAGGGSNNNSPNDPAAGRGQLRPKMSGVEESSGDDTVERSISS